MVKFILLFALVFIGCTTGEIIETERYLLPENPEVKICGDNCKCIQYDDMDKIIEYIEIQKMLDGIEISE